MDKCRKSLLSFEVGQVVELKSFIEGYRGAWFKCKIKEIRRRNRQLYYALEYVDFPDEKIKWTKVYQLPRTLEKSKEVKKELMVRPSYPPMHHENEAPKTISEVVVIFNSLWKVGDMIDCYWSANVTKILDGNKAKIELMPIPLGEGLSYEVCLKDVRPSLDWSPQHGWTLPVSQDGESNQCCALLIYPADEVAGALTVPKNDGDHTNGKTMDDSAKLDFNVKDISIVKEVVRSRQTKIHPVEDNKYTSEINRSYSNTCDVIKDVSDEKNLRQKEGELYQP